MEQFFQKKGEGRFLDRFGALWRLVPHGDPDVPLAVILLQRNWFELSRPCATAPATTPAGRDPEGREK